MGHRCPVAVVHMLDASVRSFQKDSGACSARCVPVQACTVSMAWLGGMLFEIPPEGFLTFNSQYTACKGNILADVMRL